MPPSCTCPAGRAPLAKRTPRAGAALLEVLVGLILAAILLTPLARGTAAALHHHARASLRDRAAALQSHAVARLRAGPCGGASSGDSTVRGVSLTWSAAPQAGGLRELVASAESRGVSLEVRGADVCR